LVPNLVESAIRPASLTGAGARGSIRREFQPVNS
jgi:hypothetical protein